MTFTTRTSLFTASLCLTLIAGGAGCIAEESDQELDEDFTVEVDDMSPKVWTGWTSDEFAPVTCVSGRLIHGVECHEDYCDNVRVDCGLVSGVSFGSSSWTSYFSEENTNYRVCGANEWMTGIACTGDNCDNVSIQCTEVFGKQPVSCTWSAYYSEEDGAYHTPAGYYIRGVRCRGSDCDDMSYYRCILQ